MLEVVVRRRGGWRSSGLGICCESAIASRSPSPANSRRTSSPGRSLRACGEGTMDPSALRNSMDARIQLERREMDRELQVNRAKMDKLIQAERDNLNKMIKNERDSMDTKLKEEREEMDRIIEMQHIKMETQIMQLRMDMEAKVHPHGAAIDLKLPFHQKAVPTEPYIPPPAQVEVTNGSQRVVMEFRVHAGGEFSFNPRGYHGGWVGGMTFVDTPEETAEVEWWRMVENLAVHGYKGNADLYYVHPAKVVPKGLVLMLGPGQVDDLLRDHLGRNVCDLYIVNHEREDYDVVNYGSDNDGDGA